MAVSVLFGGLVLMLTAMSAVSGLECYRCIVEDQPDANKFCVFPKPSNHSNHSILGNNTKVNCSTDQCTVMKMVQKDGTVTLFRRSCSLKCPKENGCSKPDDEGKVVCTSCCDKDLCNSLEGPRAQPSGASVRANSLGLRTFVIIVWSLFTRT